MPHETTASDTIYARFPVLIMWLALALPALPAEDTAQDPAKAAPGTALTPAAKRPTAAATLNTAGFHLVLGRNLTSNLFTRQNLLPFLIGSAGALAIAPADQEISRSLEPSHA